MITRRALLGAALATASGGIVGFQNPITGGQGALIRPAIKSPNYVPGVSGWTINRDGSVEFNNGVFRGTVTASEFDGTEFTVNSAGQFFYFPTKAFGNLIFSIASSAGTDVYGNAYAEGFTAYDQSGLFFMQLDAGILNFGRLASAGGAPVTGTEGFLTVGTNGFFQLTSPTVAVTAPSPLDVGHFAGTATGVTGSTDAPRMILTNNASGPAADFGLSGSAYKTSSGGVALTWQLPSYGTNWSGSTTFNGTAGVEPLRFRLDAEDNLWLIGAFKAGAVVPADPVFILPAGYIPAAGTDYVPALRNNAGTVTAGMLRVSNNGHVDALTALNMAIVANNEYLINGKIPLRHLT